MSEEARDWDIVSGIGITALAVAAARAVDTAREDGLIQDPFARTFVEAANPPMPMPVRLEEDSPHYVMWDQMSRFLGVRSKFFDEFLTGALASGPGQVVILAAGLDSRAFRLDLPDGTTLFEIDQPGVLRFKDDVLEAQGAKPRCERRVIPVDLREDWATALLGEGFARETPTIWLIEGLLPYLPDDAAMALLGAVHGLSAHGSVIAVEHFGDVTAMLEDPEINKMSDEFSIDFRSLFFLHGPRTTPGDHLGPRGWQMLGETANTLSDRYGRSLEGFAAKVFGSNGYYFTGKLVG
jgi:methyltransferase (TIGR00027 family)